MNSNHEKEYSEALMLKELEALAPLSKVKAIYLDQPRFNGLRHNFMQEVKGVDEGPAGEFWQLSGVPLFIFNSSRMRLAVDLKAGGKTLETVYS